MTAQERLRAELLTSGLYDDVPLAEVESVSKQHQLTETISERQELALSTMRSLVADGLMQFVGWEDLPLDEAMARVTELYVDQYGDPGAWVFAVWLKLTDAGKRVAQELRG